VLLPRIAAHVAGDGRINGHLVHHLVADNRTTCQTSPTRVKGDFGEFSSMILGSVGDEPVQMIREPLQRLGNLWPVS
jgi:hypothetical protein